MCGIVGLVSDQTDVRLDLTVFDALKHRGPDARGHKKLRSDGVSCLLGSTRLRIIDLSPDADQPMSNEDGTVWVVYNGEIYNHAELRFELERAGHSFHSRSDTEVLPHLYEAAGGDPHAMLERLRGMFAFALFDQVRRRLLVARDRLGIKPLYWAKIPGGVAFSSEARALVRAGVIAGVPSDASIAAYLRSGVVPGPDTVIEQVEQLRPGSFLTWAKEGLRVEQWWFPETAPEEVLTADAPELARAALSDAVARHLVADRPVGVFLSGGIDSGAVAAMAAREGAVRALTVSFPEDPDDETEAAAAQAYRVGAEHIRVPVTGAEVAGSLVEILRSMDQPTSDGVNTWIVCRAAREAGLVVALSGLGGDELFGGYPTFRLVPRLRRLAGVAGVVPLPVRLGAARLAARRNPGGRLARVLTAKPGYAGVYRAVRNIFGSADFEPESPFKDVGARNVPLGDNGRHPLDRVMVLELTQYLPDQLLRDTDQMSMAHSLEVRVPLLDDIVVRVALALPARVRVQRDKGLLARAVGIEGPQTKRPFTLPFHRWLRGPLAAPVREALLSNQLPFGELIPPELRRRVWEGFEEGRVHWSKPWALAVLRLWPEANGFDWRGADRDLRTLARA